MTTRKRGKKKEDDIQISKALKIRKTSSVQLQGSAATPEIHWQDCECVVHAFLTMTICTRVSARLRKSKTVQEGEDSEAVVRW
ncbi:hypothetical protein G5I_00080 [Acromyrmex echinatior]|uniref:Uncharacterized protein n=1 Tax=Acromyrmex echinatior TaxID=103372 RepID=F4W3X9_ACREC|nr:hypothetical protein G5I_00080 [Acromyrmex echinatior]